MGTCDAYPPVAGHSRRPASRERSAYPQRPSIFPNLKGGNMFTLLGARQRFCDGINRRNFLKIGALGAGLTLADMLRLRASAGSSTASSKSAIMINLPGGPSHLDMYDLKPDAPVEFRGEFKAISTNVPGVQICEYF